MESSPIRDIDETTEKWRASSSHQPPSPTSSDLAPRPANSDDQYYQRRRSGSSKLKMNEIPIRGQAPCFLFIDAYDSFAYNVVALLAEVIADLYPEQTFKIEVIKIDDKRFNEKSKRHAFLRYLRGFDAVVVGPGPGNPDNEQDVGLIRMLWDLPVENLLPVFGVCLGFQSMCLWAGARVCRLKEPRHGITTRIFHKSDSVFAGLKAICATQYHSLHIDINHALQRPGPAMEMVGEKIWNPSEACASLQPLAWDLSDDTNGSVLMAAKVKERPFWGVQFHPESIKTNVEGRMIVSNFVRLVGSWQEDKELKIGKAACRQVNQKRKFSNMTKQASDFLSARPWFDATTEEQVWAERLALSSRLEPNDSGNSLLDVPYKCDGVLNDFECETSGGLESDLNADDVEDYEENPRKTSNVPVYYGGFTFGKYVGWRSGIVARCTQADIVEKIFSGVLGVEATDIVILQSGLRRDGSLVNDETGRFSIIGIPDEEEKVEIRYYRSGQRLSVTKGKDIVFEAEGINFWDYYGRLTKRFQCKGGPPRSPFWGGCMHIISYEAGLETIGIDSVEEDQEKHGRRADIVAVVILRSIVIDHKCGEVFNQSLRPDDDVWLDETFSRIESLDHVFANDAPHNESSVVCAVWRRQKIGLDARRAEYIAKVKVCQEHIRAGESYQLCLTNTIDAPIYRSKSPAMHGWDFFSKLMRSNPAPFGAFIRLGDPGDGLSLLSSSPERFLRWTRDGDCEFRPMKGTCPKRTGETTDDALRTLSQMKEQAENIMITDLIRNDLHKVISQVKVPKLLHVEEYETVYQMVSVITGCLLGTTATGWEVLAASLPPGSMTGTPKKRSCQLLQPIEGHRPRGIYSGVVGYSDVGGGGDNAVVIRSAFKWDYEDTIASSSSPGSYRESWHIGAGGAVTAKSQPEAEYKEMRVKSEPLLRIFVQE